MLSSIAMQCLRGFSALLLFTSRGFARQQKAMLHDSVVLGPTYSRISITDDSGSISKLIPLVHEYARYPERAAIVRELVFTAAAQEASHYLTEDLKAAVEAERQKEAERLPEADETLSAAVAQLGLNETEAAVWYRALTWKAPDRYARESGQATYEMERKLKVAQYAGTLLLLLCPNIEKLTYADNTGPMSDILLRNNYGKLPSKHLQKLKHLKLIPGNAWYLNDERFYNNIDIMTVVRMFHKLPSLQTLSAETISVSNGAGYREGFAPGSSTLTKLKLTHSDLPGDLLADFIRLPGALEEVTLSEGGRAGNGGGSYVRYPGDIDKALRQQRLHLRTIDLDLDESYMSSYLINDDILDAAEEEWKAKYYGDEHSAQDKEDATGPLNIRYVPEDRPFDQTFRFNDYPRLTNLSCGVKFLLGEGDELVNNVTHRLIDALPPTLQSLTIRGYRRGRNAYYDQQIDLLLSLQAERLPALVHIAGIEKHIPSGRSLYHADDDYHLSYQPERLQTSWDVLEYETEHKISAKDEL